MLKKWFPLILISAMGLFLEMAAIRWLSAEVRLLAYIKNIPLLASFLGLSIGYASVGKGKDYKKSFAPIFLIFTILVLSIGLITSPRYLTFPSRGDEYVWYAAQFSYWASLAGYLGIVLVYFLITLLLFVPIGQATGEEMAKHAPVPAYIVNITASLVGIWLFTLISFTEVPPVVWFGIVILGMAIYTASRRLLRKVDGLLYAVCLIGLAVFSRNVTWSPYQRLSLSPNYCFNELTNDKVQIGYLLDVQQVFYMSAMNLNPDFIRTEGKECNDLNKFAASYDRPFQLIAEGGRVLVVGAGMGNDVAAALRNGVKAVEAVEIDPAIVKLGIQYHPEHPYQDSRVNIIVDDARSFFVKSNQKYDLVAFGLLDSHTLLSGKSSVRLDSFVYTLESFRQVKAHLAENGFVSLAFATDASADWIEERLGRMLAEVFGPDQIWVNRSDIELTFIAGSLTQGQIAKAGLSPWRAALRLDSVPLATDDWPYLYMRARTIPGAYWQALLAILVVTVLLLRRSFPQVFHPDAHFWLLGAGFLMVETICITRLALLFGTTWLVNALAVSGVLLMILFANLVVLRRPAINLKIIYALLFASLGLVYFFPLDSLNQLGVVGRAVTSVLLLALPLFFSGMIFSESLRRAGEAAGPLASNLSGSVFGGVLEYGSLIWGFHSLYLFTAGLYLLALGVFLKRRG